MTYSRPVSVTSSGDALVPIVSYNISNVSKHRSVRKYKIEHLSLDDETGAATPSVELFGGLLEPIAAEIQSISVAAPAIITAPNHGLVNGQRVFISGTDGDIGDQSGVVAGATTDTFNIGAAATVAGTRGRIHLVESCAKLTNFGATLLASVGPYVGLYVALNANNRATILYTEA